jgi:hypothetical protein
MTDILKDKTTGRVSKINICHYCNNETYPKGKPIIDDRHAVRTNKGDYKCGHCVSEDNMHLNMRVLGRNHPIVKDYLSKKKQEIDEYNKYARQINQADRRMGGTKDVVKPKKNPYN